MANAPTLHSLAPDKALFLELLTWYVEAADLDLDELVGLLASRFPAADLKQLRLELPLDTQAMTEAEEAVVDCIGRRPLQNVGLTQWRNEPGRNVDWTQTLLRYPGRVPEAYAEIRRTQITDAPLLAGLAGLAERWLIMLEACHTTEYRAERHRKLRTALQRFSSRPQVWNTALARRLRRFSPTAASKIEARFSATHELRGANLSQQLHQYLRYAMDTESWEAKNGDNLFELTSALAIARSAATDADNRPLGAWKLFHNREELGSHYLSSSMLLCRICKGRPKDPAGVDLLGVDCVPDKLTMLIRATGNNATGSQPDLVLTFWRATNESSCVTYLGDAKRNRSGDGRSYLVDSIGKAMVYRQAYADALGVYCVGVGPGAVSSPPLVTLFCYQACNRVANVDTPEGLRSRWKESVAEALGCKRHDVVEILAFDLRHFGLDESGTWDATVLRAWFDRLAYQAHESLIDQEAALSGARKVGQTTRGTAGTPNRHD